MAHHRRGPRRATTASPARPPAAPSNVMVELLRETGELLGEPKPITHPVKFYEKGDKPLEIVTSRQWYIRNGGRDAELREALIARGAELDWHPDYMRHRYDNWVDGLNGDWLVCRQRYFGVPIPRLVPARRRGPARLRRPDRPRRGRAADRPAVARPARLHRRPARPARRLHRRPRHHGHLGHVVAHPADRLRLGGRPRPVRPHLPDGPAAAGPRHHPHLAVLHGRPQPLRARHGPVAPTPRCRDGSSTPTARRCRSRRATSSRPIDLLEQHGSDGVRYWAASGRPGTDTAFDPGQMKVGRRLAIKLLNAAEFALGFGSAPAGAAITEPLDRAMLAELADAGRRGHHGVRGVRLRPGPGAHRGVLLALLRRLPRAGQGPRLRRGRPAADVRPGHAAPRPVDAAAAVRPVPPVRHRGGLVVVPDRRGRCRTSPRSVHPRPGRRPHALRDAAGDGDPLVLDRRRRRPRPRSARPSPTPRSRCGPRSTRSSSATPPTASPRC